MKRFLITLSLVFSLCSAHAQDHKGHHPKNMKGKMHKMSEACDGQCSMSGKDSSIFSTRNLAWSTLILLGATAVTAEEKKTNPTHISLATLSLFSYGAFLHSYFSNPKYSSAQGRDTYKGASYSKWVSIPAMLILPVAGAIAQRQYEKQGKTDAEGFAKFHKPAALGAITAMALTTVSLTFTF